MGLIAVAKARKITNHHKFAERISATRYYFATALAVLCAAIEVKIRHPEAQNRRLCLRAKWARNHSNRIEIGGIASEDATFLDSKVAALNFA
jgi:hypothetical protein